MSPVDVWVVLYYDSDDDVSVAGVSYGIDGADLVAREYLYPGWPAFEWFRNKDDFWVTDVKQGCRFTAERFEVQP